MKSIEQIRKSGREDGSWHQALTVTLLLVVGCHASSAAPGPPPADASLRACQEYLDVRWISAERLIGTTEYELVDQGGKRRKVHALAFLGGHSPRIDYQMTLIPSPAMEGASKNIDAASPEGEAILRDWKVTYGLRGDAIGFSSENGKSYRVEVGTWDFRESLAKGTQITCVSYPDRRREWVVELPSAGLVYGAKVRERYEQALRQFPAPSNERPSIEQFSKSGVFDVNHDGLYDFPSLRLFSYRGEYFLLRRRSAREQDLEQFGELVFGGNGATCEMDPPDENFVVIEGQDVYLNKKCNLTKILRKEK